MKNNWIAFEVPVFFWMNSSEADEEERLADLEDRKPRVIEKRFETDMCWFEVNTLKDNLVFHPHQQRNKTLLLHNGEAWKVDLTYPEFKELWEKAKKEFFNNRNDNEQT